MTKHDSVAGGMDYLTDMFVSPAKDTLAQLKSNVFGKVLLSALAATILAFASDHVAAFVALMVMVLLDQITGTWVAMRNGSFSSSGFRQGIIKLVCYSIIIVTFHLLEVVTPAFVPLSLDSLAIVYLAVTEALSVMENASSLSGIQLSKEIKERLEKMLGKKDE